ncbi:hypothetical protein FT663_03098 [Candidozyma haemuli var. vulneris]|uniref:Mitochondrial import receptor subunit TOM20 n=1 Tax=Candidozyma haemuli TaxID=45357 RepID=A0A2V1AW46_9ASCO|nr:hypothetical protein CXQ85_000066 [[Candida] haemuloni]KAF3989345.1 hypothetical protein FT662_02896 [[Candida] haemuloni var. vulneris]KAF3990652.1 hypothetical protein FT663_03098 [[Candida] haemuloni var. vulneris]PVH21101.1 hypothetical protein CXQ85_000066 [[Candida] haemuloni]
MNKPLTFISVAAAGLAAYAVYFDYTRRNDPAFRKSLKKRASQMEKEDAKAKAHAKHEKRTSIKKALFAEVIANPPPVDAASKENYFLEQISTGERLSPAPGKQLQAALSFYKALAVYPNPTDVLNVYQNSVPADVFEIVKEMIAIQDPAKIHEIIIEATKEASQSAKQPTQADLD